MVKRLINPTRHVLTILEIADVGEIMQEMVDSSSKKERKRLRKDALDFILQDEDFDFFHRDEF